MLEIASDLMPPDRGMRAIISIASRRRHTSQGRGAGIGDSRRSAQYFGTAPISISRGAFDRIAYKRCLRAA